MPTTTQEEKEKLRRELLGIRSSAAPASLRAASDQISSHLPLIEAYLSATTITAYWPKLGGNEINTRQIIADALERNVSVFLPRVTNWASGTMEHVRYRGQRLLKANRYGLFEPREENGVLSFDVEIALVPCVAADSKGFRLGYGRGFYDRYLSQSNATKIGLVLASGIRHELPHNAHDIAMDWIVTEDGPSKCVP